jgi:hypothetical protein
VKQDCTKVAGGAHTLRDWLPHFLCWLLMALALWGFQRVCILPTKENPFLRGDSIVLAMGFGLADFYFFLVPRHINAIIGNMFMAVHVGNSVSDEDWRVIEVVGVAVDIGYGLILAYGVVRVVRRLIKGRWGNGVWGERI